MMPKSTRRHLSVSIIALAALGVQTAEAQSLHEDLKLIAMDAEYADFFGHSVAISGTKVIVGAHFNDDAGFQSGSAYLFDAETGLELFKLTADDAAVGDVFGGSVAISGTTAIVGAMSDDDAGTSSGSAYLYDIRTGEQLFKLTASDADSLDYFGHSVAISGSVAIVGSHTNYHNGIDSGSAYLFDTETGQQLFKLTPSDAAPSDRFGFSVAISGTTAIVGAYLNDNAVRNSDSGAAYIFDTKTGDQLFKLTASDVAEDHRFGYSVAISGTTAIVGAFLDRDSGSASGSAYLFDTVTGLQLFKLSASDAAPADFFGFDVAISGTTAIVGTQIVDDTVHNSSSAYLFDTLTGLQTAKLTASDAGAEDRFALSVGISGTTVIVGAYLDEDSGIRSGSAYLFTVPTTCPADLNTDGELDFLDISAFLAAFTAQDPAADLNSDTQLDFLDISLFISGYAAGCP